MPCIQKITRYLPALGIGTISTILFLAGQPAWGQIQNSQLEVEQGLLRLAEQQTQEGQPKQAIESLQKILVTARLRGDKKTETTALVGIGFNLIKIGQPTQALTFFNQALLIVRESGDQAEEAKVLNNIGSAYDGIGKPQKALEFYNQALLIRRNVGDQVGEATTLNNIGLNYDNAGQPQKALEFYNQALLLRRKVGDQVGEARTLNNIGKVYSRIGSPQKALELYNQALEIIRRANNYLEQAPVLNNIGALYNSIAQPQKALEFYSQALVIMRAVKNQVGEGTTLSNIGTTYNYLGQFRRSIEFYNNALLIQRETKDRAGEATTLNNIGRVLNRLDRPNAALKFYNIALSIQNEVNDQAGKATTLINIGRAYDDLEQRQKALKFYSAALSLAHKVEDRNGEAVILNNIGAIYSKLKQLDKAVKSYNQALQIFHQLGDTDGESRTLNNVAEVYQKRNRLTDAIVTWERSFQMILETRRGLIRENRQQFLQAEHGGVNALVSVLIDRNAPQRAYEWVNLATTTDLADYTRLVNGQVSNSEAQQAIQAWQQENQRAQFFRQQLQQKFSKEGSIQVRALEAKVNQQAEDISQRFPEIAELFETTPAEIDQLRASIPAETTVLHPVFLTDTKNLPDTIALFILTKDKLVVVKIPINPDEFNNLLASTYQQLTNRLDDRYLDNLTKLYDLLIRPIEVQIKATHPKQLSIIATGKLRYLPFETLYDNKAGQYLIQKYPVSYLTRLSPRSLVAKTNINSTTAKRILALGNPVPEAPLALPGAETEVKSITQILPGSEALIGSEATLESFKVQALRFPLLHLATHGCFQKGGCPKLGLKENTLLFADQRYNIADASLLGLQNVELITLSACQTALETNSNGEEISGLAYLFERAGARAVIASLWSAEDKTTQAIMVQFYNNLKQGMSKGEALQKAKLSQIDSHPFFWAPFVLIGDAR